MRLLRDPRAAHAWRNAFLSLVAMAGAIYAVTASFSH
jgi:hypothetical protein